jgi:flavorubredoxin
VNERMKINPNDAVEIKPNVWWIGWPDYNAGFSNNPYLIKDGEEYVIIDPGSRLEEHWSVVKRKIETIVPIEKITMVIVTHQDPDLCAAIPLIEQAVGVDNFEIVTTERASLFIPYYDVRTKVTVVEDGDIIEIGDSGRELVFLTTPYLHFPGSMVVYDRKEKILFSSDIFGAFSVDWSLYANKHYKQAVINFAETYLSDKRHIDNFLGKINPLELELICPQHGSIIPKERIQEMIDAITGLEVGIWK